MSKVYVEPTFRGLDEGDGGIRRVVEAMKQHLPVYGYEITTDIHKADIVHTHAGSCPEVPLEIPWITSCHGLYWQEYNWAKWCHDLNRQVIDAMRKADHVTAPSEWVAQALRRGMWLRPSVLHHGVDMEDWKPAENHADYVLWNKNRPDPICDPTPLITLADQAQDLSFVTTFGPERPNVRVCGRVDYPTMNDLIRNAGVYLSTTRETFGIGTLEAMAAGVPVVGWAWGGQREIIEHGETGWLCRPGDYDGLIEGIHWALKHRRRIGGKARAVVRDRYTWRKRMEDYATLYERLIREKAERQGGPVVSVVIPCYNLAHVLPDAIASLQAQTMRDWEAIIVNDASPDDTAETAAALAKGDPRVRVTTNERNLYLAGTLNAGIAEARGRYILPLDADNMIEPWTLEVLSKSLDQDRGIHIAYGGCRFVLEDGVSRDTSISVDGVSTWPGEFSFRAQVGHKNQIPSTAMFRRQVWERSGGYRRRCRTAEDAENWTRVTSLGFVPKRVTSRPTLIYRQRPDSMSRIQADWGWTAWFPWSQNPSVVPFGVGEKPPSSINDGIAWNVSSCEPIRVAIIIPVGPGHEELVIDALDSLEAQTFRAWECIVVNDTGGPLHIPHSWAKVIEPKDDPASDRMYHTFHSSEEDPAFCGQCGETDNWHVRMGPAAARNAAISESKAALFLPLDADDYLQPDALALMVQAWDQYGGVIYSQWYDDKGDVIEIYDPSEYDARLLVSKGTIHTVTALYPRSAWVTVGGFDPDLSHWEDWDFQLKLAAHGICGTKIPIPLLTYRKNTGMRREANIAAFEEGKSAILSKWSSLWDGKETLMACSGCPGGGGSKYAAPPTVQHMSGNLRFLRPREGYVILSYFGTSTSTRIYRGKVTGTAYRFGNNPAHQVKYVYGEDVAPLLELMDGGRQLFQVITPSVQEGNGPVEPQIVAAGPPIQSEPEAEVALEEMPSSAVRDYTVKELRLYSWHWVASELTRYLEHEEGKQEPRQSAIALLRGRLSARS